MDCILYQLNLNCSVTLILSCADRPNRDLVYPIGVDFCLESANSFPDNITIVGELAEIVHPLPTLTFEVHAVTSDSSRLLNNFTLLTDSLERTYKRSLTQDDLSGLFEDEYSEIRLTFYYENRFGNDTESTLIHVCCK